jgi:hypothetical protein
MMPARIFRSLIEETQMENQRCVVSFNGSQVVVCSNAPEVIDGLRHSFRQMISTEPKSTVNTLNLYRSGLNYHLGLDGGRGEVTEPSLEKILGTAEHEIALQLIRANPGYLWFHSGAVADGEKALMFLGNWGCGKSTLVTSLCERGWNFLADDIVPVDPAIGCAYPFPRAPRVRKHLGMVLPPDTVQQLPKMDVSLNVAAISQGPVSIGAFVFPMYNPDQETSLEPVSPGTAALELIQGCLNFSAHRNRAIRHITELLNYLPAFRLSYRDGSSAASLVMKKI